MSEHLSSYKSSGSTVSSRHSSSHSDAVTDIEKRARVSSQVRELLECCA
jgi:hypothetical protein